MAIFIVNNISKSAYSIKRINSSKLKILSSLDKKIYFPNIFNSSPWQNLKSNLFFETLLILRITFSKALHAMKGGQKGGTWKGTASRVWKGELDIT